jgi:zinc finger-like protein
LSSSEEFDENGRRVLGKYYCHVCKLWDNSLSKHIYHCPYCNVCRVGKGLGIDYRHCMACNCCVELRADREADKASHKCVSQALGGSCAVCTESLRFSTKPLKGLPCGHTLHLGCYTQYRRYAYTCPVCLKSMDDMREYFGRLDREEANEIIGRGGGGGGGFGGGGGSSSGGFTLPQQLGGGVVGHLDMTNTRNRIACNDCGARELVPFRMLHHKCPCCGSYNTRVLETVVLRPGESS